MLGVIMLIAFIAQYPFVNTRFYSTFSRKIPYTVQYFPMCIAGCYIAVESLRQIIDEILMLKKKKEA